MWVDPLSLSPEWVKLWVFDHLGNFIDFSTQMGLQWDNRHLDRSHLVKCAIDFYSKEMELPVLCEKGKLIVRVPDKDVVYYMLKA